ncbi:MAG: ATP-binding cassette domain-containing protein, partial [Clostridia bacterium]|nr:ATP-binding cassette domain-containing protein [Clostridia bacterium]
KKALDGISCSVDEGDFVCICAPTGNGKTTLLKMLKRELSPVGEKSGTVYYRGADIDTLSPVLSAKSIGYVMQDPGEQIVTDKVWHELAFGAENLGLPQDEIRRRVAEMASYFGIEKWFDKKTDELSGGQKQLLNLASVMVMQPDVIILDEPTAQLDPIAATDFLSTVRRINTELCVTVIITEHRLEDVIPVCDKLMIMQNGKITDYGKVREVCERIRDGEIIKYLPCAVRVHRMLNSAQPCPLNVREGRQLITGNYRNETRSLPENAAEKAGEKAVEVSGVYFRYSKDAPDVVFDLSFSAHAGEMLCIFGANGSGKSTALSLVAGLRRPYCGKIRVLGKKINDYKGNGLYKNTLAMLPQDVRTLFYKNTVAEELLNKDCSAFFPYDISGLYNKHPYDLSGGEQQLVALAKVLMQNPRVLLLDEPTKGLDVNTKQIISEIISALKKHGVCIVTVTHDMEFACKAADRCALFFRGNILCVQPPREFFSTNSFYTTSAVRMTKGFYDGALTDEDIVSLCLLNGRAK